MFPVREMHEIIQGSISQILCSMLQNHLEGSLKRITGPHPPLSDSAVLRSGPRICTSNKFQGIVVLLFGDLHLENH